MQSILLIGLACLATAFAGQTTLFVSSYTGNITSLNLTECDGQYVLSHVSDESGCSPNPSWLTLDFETQSLFCLDEGLNTPNGSLSSYSIGTDGILKPIYKRVVPSGPVSGAIYNVRGAYKGSKAIALAHYTGSAVTNYYIGSVVPTLRKQLQDFTFSQKHPGPDADRQDAPHPHEAIKDPTSQYVLVPDLGADLVHIFSSDENANLKALTPLSTLPGYGPRHAVFYNPSGCPGENQATFMYLVGELSNNVTGYSVTYLPHRGGLSFKQIYQSTTYGPEPLPVGNAAAEIQLSPDNRFAVISNRNNSQFTIPNPDPKNNAKVQSDSLSTFALSPDGQLRFQDVVPSGGSFPRAFSMNQKGDLVGVGLQYGGAVVLLERDVASGRIGNTVASYPIANVTNVRWNEPVFDGTNSNNV